jgi:beta-phosphoglucomutase
MPLCAFIFDMDGTLVDNARFHTQSWMEIFRGLRVPIKEEELHIRAGGKTAREVLQSVMGDRLSISEIDEYSERKERLYRKLCRPHLKLLEGLEEFLTEARRLEIPMAVATSAREGNIEFVLGGLGIKSYFTAVIGAQDVLHSKPHPEMFLAAARRLGIASERCIVFEDSLAGIEAAHRAGMQTVVVTTTLSAVDFRHLPGVKMAVEDFRAVHPASLLK